MLKFKLKYCSTNNNVINISYQTTDKLILVLTTVSDKICYYNLKSFNSVLVIFKYFCTSPDEF